MKETDNNLFNYDSIEMDKPQNTPLAFALRPKNLDEISGQKHLVGNNGVIRKMVNSGRLTSMILFGDPGIGKTTLAMAICNELHFTYGLFNASSDKKETLKKLIDSDTNLLIIDEIHRMKKDTQDYLLPYVESGKVIMIGITTINPYRAVNPAIRSRATVYKLYNLDNNDLLELVNKAIKYLQIDNPEFDLDNDCKRYLINLANGEGRVTINMVENLYLVEGNKLINLDRAKEIIMKPNIDFDKNGDDYYNTLSALHKSIRGSDVDASLHYLGILLYTEDFLPLVRRLYCIAYEDISLANPGIGPKVRAACEAALELGMPEARLPLASIVVEMALSPKSNSSYLAIDKVLEDIDKGNTGPVPPHLKNVYAFEEGNGTYKYPHDYPGAWVNQQYLPDKIKDVTYYIPKTTSKYENALKERWDAINKAKNKIIK